MMKLKIFLVAIIVLSSSALGEDKLPENYGLNNCMCPVTLELKPVCGSNGATYANYGALMCAGRCLKQNDLTKVHDGACKN